MNNKTVSNMKTVTEILSVFGVESVDEMNVNEKYSIDGGAFMDLTIEKVSDERLSVAHFFSQGEDRFSDPKVVFDTSNDEWVPVMYTQHPIVHQHDEEGIEASAFIEKWDNNLEKQGFVERAKEN